MYLAYSAISFPLRLCVLFGAIFALLLAGVVGFVFGTVWAADSPPSVRPRIIMRFVLAFADGHVVGTLETSLFRDHTPANVFRGFVGYGAHFLVRTAYRTVG
jgi:hypothetical protein